MTAASSVDELRATARRLRSTLLAYFVTADTTYVWVVPPDGPIGAAQVTVSAARLTDLVRQTRPGETPKPTETETTGATLRLASSSAPPLRTRGPDTFTLAVHRSPAWRTLHRLLIRPVEDQLPGMAGSRLTILPHGPLSLLSFAALEDDRGRYLLERFTLHYAPAAGALRFTEQTQRRLTDTDSRYLLVADPSAMPSNGRRPLRALPASRREVTTIASLLPRDAASVLTGAAAGEADVRARLAGATVVHFATHGIVRSDAPLESFLALGRSDDAAASDGRLTAAEIYDLNLHADVVILSACRTALGTVSGDGVLGLTRAFFYAGAASIVATMWDVADDPTMRLIPDFYRRRLTGTDKAEALRAAQLTLLRDLRAGRVTIGEGASKVALPENPFFWAGFVLTGEP